MSKLASVDRWVEDIPAWDALGVFYYNFDVREIQCCRSIKTDVGQDERPFEEGIYSICYLT